MYNQISNLPGSLASHLNLLKIGNESHLSGQHLHYKLNEHRLLLKEKQSPDFIILTCMDSRVVPNYIFDCGLGSIFVIRNAGNTADDCVMGSIEFAISELKPKLIVVLGHENCGAINKVLDLSDNEIHGSPASDGETSIYSERLYKCLMPSVEKYRGCSMTRQEKIKSAALENVSNQMRNITEKSKIVQDSIDRSNLAVLGAFYHFSTGKVDFLEIGYFKNLKSPA